jgi:DNA-directed RNA polymerase specialized sigma24 family protein
LDLYRPLIFGWLSRQGVPTRDLEDLSQEVLLSVVKHLPTFQHSGHRGAFRSWLRTIVCSRASDYWQTIDAGTQATGGSDATAVLQKIADPDSALNRLWDEEHDRYVLHCLLDLVEEELELPSRRGCQWLLLWGRCWYGGVPVSLGGHASHPTRVCMRAPF